MGTVYGSSSVTIPAADQGLKCDVMFVDGDKRPSGRFADLQNFRQRSYSGARLFFDDLAREECVNGCNNVRRRQTQVENGSSSARPPIGVAASDGDGAWL